MLPRIHMGLVVRDLDASLFREKATAGNRRQILVKSKGLGLCQEILEVEALQVLVELPVVVRCCGVVRELEHGRAGCGTFRGHPQTGGRDENHAVEVHPVPVL